MGTGMMDKQKHQRQHHCWWHCAKKSRKSSMANRHISNIQNYIRHILSWQPPEEDLLEDFRLDGCPSVALEHRQWPDPPAKPPTCRKCGGIAKPIQLEKTMCVRFCHACLKYMKQEAVREHPLDLPYPDPPGYIEPLWDLE